MKNIGFIGLGNMGFFMSKNLSSDKYTVNGYDINKDVFNKLKEFGVNQKMNLNDISNDNDIIITMLPNGVAVEETWTKILNNIQSNTLLVDCSTIDIETTKKIHKMANDKNILSLDAPVSGGTIGADNGSLTFMVGGETKAYKKMLPLFKVMGQKSILCGAAGSGQATKMCNNLLLAITMSGLGEAIRLANSESLNMEKFYEVLSTSTGSCWALNNYAPIKGIGPESPADNEFKPGFSSQLMLKDLSLALTAAKKADLNLTFGKEVLKKYQRLINNNKGNLDFSNIINQVD